MALAGPEVTADNAPKISFEAAGAAGATGDVVAARTTGAAGATPNPSKSSNVAADDVVAAGAGRAGGGGTAPLLVGNARRSWGAGNAAALEPMPSKSSKFTPLAAGRAAGAGAGADVDAVPSKSPSKSTAAAAGKAAGCAAAPLITFRAAAFHFPAAVGCSITFAAAVPFANPSLRIAPATSDSTFSTSTCFSNTLALSGYSGMGSKIDRMLGPRRRSAKYSSERCCNSVFIDVDVSVNT